MSTQQPSRRSFLKSSAAASGAVVASGSLGALRAASPVHQGGGKLKVGIVGVGGRGSGAALQSIMADEENILYAAGDAFVDRLESGLAGIQKGAEGAGRKNQFQVTPERRFVGLDALDQVLATGVDVVLLATPPGFRPMQIERAVEKGVHVFAEKPIATDAPGVRRVEKACALAKKKGISVVSGLCYRYHDGRRATVQKLQEGAIGDILTMQGNYITGELWFRPVEDNWSDLQKQVRNWLYYTWLSCDHIGEQHIHTLDMLAWIKGDVYPKAATSLGGRQKRTDPKFGNVFDHFSTTYEWEDGTRGIAQCRQQNNCWRDVNEYIYGTKGRATIARGQCLIQNDDGIWRYEGPQPNMYQVEHDEMYASIRDGNPINNGARMCNATMMGIMGRIAGYTGKQVTWDQALNSKQALFPKDQNWETGKHTPPAEAIPGTKDAIAPHGWA